MRIVLFVVILAHGLIHLMGFAKAFEYAELRDLKQEISKPVGLLWLFCALAFLGAGVLFISGRASWWWLGAPALVLSQVVILMSWGDAKFGTLANLILLVPLVAAGLESRPTSYGNQYRAAAREGLVRIAEMPLVTEADLAPLPAPVQRHLRYAGVVGRPQIHNFRAVFTGDFRNGLDSRWMRFRSEQVNVFDEPARAFLMSASMFGLPMEGLHVFRDGTATMQIKVASLVQVVDARGPKMNQGETVTLFNDLCLMAPARLVDTQRIQWEAVGPLQARARFTNRGVTIGALLSFGESGQLSDFISNDRFLSADGKTYTSYPWSTPVRDYKRFDGRMVPSYGEAVWHTPEGELSYGRFTLVGIEYNLSEPR
jgi:hypothetical protein